VSHAGAAAAVGPEGLIAHEIDAARGACRRRGPATWPAPLSYLGITETVTLISDTPRILTFVPDTRRVKSSSP
jgi:hypothetical protein